MSKICVVFCFSLDKYQYIFFEYNFVFKENIFDDVIDNGLKAYKIVYNTPPTMKMTMKIMKIFKLFNFGV